MVIIEHKEDCTRKSSFAPTKASRWPITPFLRRAHRGREEDKIVAHPHARPAQVLQDQGHHRGSAARAELFEARRPKDARKSSKIDAWWISDQRPAASAPF